MSVSDTVDEKLEAEPIADPDRFQGWDHEDSLSKEHSELNQLSSEIPHGGRHNGYETEQLPIVSSSSTSARSSQREGTRSRLDTRRARSTRSVNASHNGESNPTAVERLETQWSQHLGSVGSRTTTKRKEDPLPNFGGGKPYPPVLSSSEDYVVDFDGQDDPMHGQNWEFWKKMTSSAVAIWCSLATTFSSALFDSAASGVESEFHVGAEVGTLGTSLFVLGYAFGPTLFAPMSELYGRKIPMVVSTFGFAVFGIGVATAENIQTALICRFFSGTFGSAPLTIVAAIMADLYGAETRGLAIACYAFSAFSGPLFAPFIGGFIADSYLGWRWTMYLPSIMGFSACILCVFVLNESYPPSILVGKASSLRRRTKNWGIHAKQEELEIDLKELIGVYLARPLVILFTEPIVLLVSIYLGFIYGLLYAFLTSYGLVFQEIYGMNAGVAGLPYFGLIAGEAFAFLGVVLMNPSYVRKLKANNLVAVPEWRLPLVMIGAFIFAGGLFWFGWTGYTGKIPWIVPTLSGLFTGFGLLSIFLQLNNYLIDAYVKYAASAIAGNTVMRSVFGAVFPLFARYMYDAIGIQWGQTLLGAIAVVMIPVPFIFHYKGRQIRARSTIAPALDIQQDKKRDEESRGDNGIVEGNNEVERTS